MKEIKLEILTQSYWIHFKEAKDLALYYPADHQKVKLFTQVIENIRLEIEKIKSCMN